MKAKDIEREFSPEVLALCAEPWRILPHTFAEHVGLQSIGGPWHRTRLADYLCETIADAVMAGGARLVINCPPRRGKSEAVSFAVLTWFLEHFPSEPAILATHTASLSLNYARRIRNEFANNPQLTTKLQEDAQAANQWNTSEGGGLKAVGVGGAVLGFGGKLIIGDDLHRGWVEAQSPVERFATTQWLEGTLLTRLEPGGSIIMVQQRLNKNDATGHVIKKGGWTIIKLPALARLRDPMGRAPGDPICPERYSKSDEEQIKRTTPEDMYAAQYDQEPDEVKIGRTYGSFSDANLEAFELAKQQPVCVTFDFNVNPGMHAVIGQSNTHIDRIAWRKEIHGPRMKTPECAKMVAEWIRTNGPFGHCTVYGDRSGKTENTQTSKSDYTLIAQVFRENGLTDFSFSVPEANPAIKSRVAAMNDALQDRQGERHLYVHPTDCPRLVNDLENLSDDEDGLPDKSDTDLSHSSDAVGYAVHRIRPIQAVTVSGGQAFAPPPRR